VRRFPLAIPLRGPRWLLGRPLPAPRGGAAVAPAVTEQDGPARAPAADTTDARALRASAVRRVWSTLWDRRDWVAYIYVPIIVPLLVLVPYLVVSTYQRTHWLGVLVQSFSQGSRDLETLSQMLKNRPASWPGEPAEEASNLDVPDLKGFDILQDSRIVDLRNMRPGQPRTGDQTAPVHRRLKVVKQSENNDNNLFRLHLLPTSPDTAIHFPAQRLQPRLRRSAVGSSVTGQEECHWEASFDFEGVPPGEYVDLLVEYRSPGAYLEGGASASAFSIPVQTDTAELTVWILMPRGKEYRDFHISRHEMGKPEKVEAVHVVTEYLAEDFRILAFKLLALKPGWTYEISWVYK
jgi:hypothetical protein